MRPVFPTRTRGFLPLALSALLLLANTAEAHTWGEEQWRIARNGTFVGSPGFARGYKPRDQDQNQDYLVNKGHNVILPTDKAVNPTRSKLTDAMYSADAPMLKVAPGDFVAFMYTENGHVSKQDIFGGNAKPINRGTVYVYATYENDLSDYNLVDIHLKWNQDGTGGDGKGKLVATRNYDDGQCHEVIPSGIGDQEGITTFRMAHLKGGYELLPCQTDIKVPLDAKVGKTLTFIWVWDWPTQKPEYRGLAVTPATYNDTTQSDAEIYTSVADYLIVDPCDDSLGEVKGPTCNKDGKEEPVQFLEQPDPARSGIRAQMEDLFMVQLPQAGFNVKAAAAPTNKIPLAILIGNTEPVTAQIPQETLLNSPAKPALNLEGGSEADEPPSPSVSALPSSEPSQAPPSSRPTQFPSSRPSQPSVSSKPTPTSSPPPATTSPATGGDVEDGVLIVTVTVPETTVFVTSTTTETAKVVRTTTPTSSASSSSLMFFEPTPTPNSKRSNLRRGRGEWTFGAS
ncbi:hypothetical protein V8F20_001985 [Naviculisporaceae sp. PSN 640]